MFHCFRPIFSARGSQRGSTGDFRWDGTDRILREDFNSNWEELDTQLKANADAVAAAAAALEKCGNRQITISIYTGTGSRGEKHPTVITFPRMPTAFLVGGRATFFAAQGGARRWAV